MFIVLRFDPRQFHWSFFSFQRPKMSYPQSNQSLSRPSAVQAEEPPSQAKTIPAADDQRPSRRRKKVYVGYLCNSALATKNSYHCFLFLDTPCLPLGSGNKLKVDHSRMFTLTFVAVLVALGTCFPSCRTMVPLWFWQGHVGLFACWLPFHWFLEYLVWFATFWSLTTATRH